MRRGRSSTSTVLKTGVVGTTAVAVLAGGGISAFVVETLQAATAALAGA